LASLPHQSKTPQIIEVHPVAEYDTKGTRLTCVTIAEGDGSPEPHIGKRKRVVDGDEQNESKIQDEDDDGWLSGDDETGEEGSTGRVDDDAS
jgi:protein MAK11